VQCVEVAIMTTLASTRTSLGHVARQEARERPTVALRLLVLLAVMVAVIIAATVGAAPPAPAAGIRAAVILLIAALTIVWARG